MASAKTRFTNWINEMMEKEVKEFYTVANTVKNNLDNILNFFINQNTNPESFNSKIKLFTVNQRGVVVIAFFLFRLHKLFA